VDWASPFKGCFDQMSGDFSSTREPDVFEAANAYYHIDTYMRYINDTLGVPVHPFQYAGGVQYDPAGFSGADNSSYSPGTGRLQYGEGGVDDAEDADVIIHELGHGIHDWLTAGGGSQVQGLSEGLGDYFAASYSRSFPGQWGPADPQYNWVFSWDGHNEWWSGRVTNWNDTHHYPENLVGEVHTEEQFWSSCNIDITEQIGVEETDRAVLGGIGMTNGSTNQEDAAQAVLQAASDIGYSSGDVSTMASIYSACGYTVSAPLDVIFADGFESGSTSAWSATVP
jgi:zinc metalloprotease ZmpB